MKKLIGYCAHLASVRMAAAIDWGRERWKHVAWLAGGGGMGK